MTWDAFDRNAHLCLDGLISRLSTHPVAAGGYADVWKGSLEGQEVAIKVMRPFASTGRRIQQAKLIKRLWREYLAWSDLSHPNVLQCLGFSYDFSPDSYIFPSLISPWMSNGTAVSYLDAYPDVDCLKVLLEVAEGLAYLHTREPAIIHGDLRAGNILISDRGVPCLCDFSLSRVLSEVRGMTTSTEVAGSLRWMAPELFQADNDVTVYSDIWAFGMTSLELLSGERPYSTVKSDIFVFSEIRDGHTPSRPQSPKALQMISDQTWTTCGNCWALQPTLRPSIQEVKAMLLGSDELVQDYLFDEPPDPPPNPQTHSSILKNSRMPPIPVARTVSPYQMRRDNTDMNTAENPLSASPVQHVFLDSAGSWASSCIEDLFEIKSISPSDGSSDQHVTRAPNIPHDDDVTYEPSSFFDLYDGGEGEQDGHSHAEVDIQPDQEETIVPPLSPVNSIFESQLAADIKAAHAGHVRSHSHLLSIEVRVVRFTYNGKGSRDKASVVVQVFPSGVGDVTSSWKVEKLYSDLLILDAHVGAQLNEYHRDRLGAIPSANLFNDYAPSKQELRKIAIEEYLQRVLQVPLKSRIYVGEFFRTDLVDEADFKEGYLAKRGKHLGRWKARYFVLRSAILEYYESYGGSYLGSIALTGAQIGRQQKLPVSDAIDKDDYRHALLIIEPSKTGQHARHVLCAKDDQERDSWVNVLVRYVTGSYDEDPSRTASQSTLTVWKPHPSSQVEAVSTLSRRAVYTGGEFGFPDRPSPEPDGIGDREKKYKPRRFWSFAGDMAEGERVSGLSQAVFAVTIADSLRVAQIANLPAVVFRCIHYLETTKAYQEEGLYYVSGSSSVIKSLKDRFNAEGDVDLLASDEIWDPHAIAGLLKSFLRELPASILTRELQAGFLAVNNLPQLQRLDELAQLISQLPHPNYCLLRALAAHLVFVVHDADNKRMSMSMKNIGIAFSRVLGISADVLNLMLREINRVFTFHALDEDAPSKIPEHDLKNSGRVSLQNGRESPKTSMSKLP